MQPNGLVFFYDLSGCRFEYRCSYPEPLLGISMHCTNGIIIQMKKQNLQLPTYINIQNSALVTKLKFTPVNMDILPYYQCERLHPTEIHYVIKEGDVAVDACAQPIAIGR